jgi:hypothetical protein
MRTYPIKDDAGVLFAFEINAQLLGGRLARVLGQVEGVSDVRRRRWWVGSPDVHIRFLYRGREYIVWEPFGDNSRWWIGPEQTSVEPVSLVDIERAVANRSRVRESGEVLTWRILGLLLLALSAFGFVNAFVLKLHGPGGDLGVIAGILALCAFGVARWIARRG